MMEIAERHEYEAAPAVNARFWEYWNGTWVKLTILAGQSLSLFKGGPTEEGYSRSGMEFFLSTDGELTVDAWSDGRDCDGRCSSSSIFTTTVLRMQRLGADRDLPDPENSYRPVTPPKWDEGRLDLRDFAAEAAGY